MSNSSPAREQRLGKQAIELMEKHQIAPSPENYAIWYRYVETSNPGLSEEIDKILTNHLPFGETTTQYLYNKFIISDSKQKAVEDAAFDTQKVLAEVQKLVQDFSGETSNYNKGVDRALTDISKNLDEGNVKNIVRNLVETTKALKANGEQMSKKLEESTTEINSLRQNLQQVTAESQRDSLTGLYNRKTFEKFFDQYAQQALENKSELCLMIIDIDHFKQFNDKFGHLIGDEVLKIVSRALTDGLKGRDIVGRFGGEEFTVLLPETPLEGAMKVADIIRGTIASKELKRRDTGENYGRITVSIGVAHYRHGSDTLPALTKRADDALYKSKREGRNRVTKEA